MNTIREAIEAWLKQAAQQDQDINDSISWLENHVQDVIEEKMEELGYEFDEENLTWRKG